MRPRRPPILCARGWLREYLKRVRMDTVWLPMCSTGAPMARAGGGNIPGNNLGQGFTSPSTFTHVPGAYGAPTGAVGGGSFCEYMGHSDFFRHGPFPNGLELCLQTQSAHSSPINECAV